MNNWVEAGFMALAAGNLFFIKRIVSKIDSTSEAVNEIGLLHEQIRGLKEQIGTLSQCIREITDLKRDVSVLQFAVLQFNRDKGE